MRKVFDVAQMGMDVDAVESVGRQLKQSADAVNGIVSGIDKTVNGLLQVWDGPDAQRFVQQSWPTFRKSLVAAQTTVEGLGQSALNNASEQREASGANPSGGTPSLGNSGGTHVGTTQPTETPSAGFDRNTEQQGYDNRDPHRVPSYFMPGNGGFGQCTSWVNYRRQELVDEHLISGPVPTKWNDDLTAFYPGTVSKVPSLYAVGSFSDPNHSDGTHTFVVESISSDSRTISISEMNVGAEVDGNPVIRTGLGTVSTETYTEVGDGLWRRGSNGPVQAIDFGA